MNTDQENALRSIEVARTKLKLLSSEAAHDAGLTETGALLDQAHAILSGSTGLVPAPAPVTANISPAGTGTTTITAADLTQIKRIDAAMASSLAQAGIKDFDEIANWRADDVANLTRALSLGTRINRENWIEEAAILAKGGKTAYLRSLPPKRPAPEIPQAINTPEPVTPEAIEPEEIAPEPVEAETVTPVETAPPVSMPPEEVPTKPNAPIPNAPELVVASAAVAASAVSAASATIEEISAEEVVPAEQEEQAAPIEPIEPQEPIPVTEPDVPGGAPVEASITPPNDAREATIEIKPRTDSQLAYPNTDEDPEQVVERFMRALTGDSDNEE